MTDRVRITLKSGRQIKIKAKKITFKNDGERITEWHADGMRNPFFFNTGEIVAVQFL